MGVPGNANALLLRSAAAAGGYQISRSLRFNSSDSASCSRSFASAGNRRTWTLSLWVKRSAIAFSAEQHIWGVTGTTDATYGEMFFGTGDTLRFAVGYNTTYGITTTRVFRDPSAWYHIVLAFDATQSTAANKIKLYINGVEETTFSSDTRSSLANQDWGYNNNVAHYIGRQANSDIRQFNGYLADVHFIDGQALTPSSFTEVSATTGQLIPKAYTGSFGTNGFWLPFSDNSNNTATTLGKDYSGNGNNWTPNNLSVTAGAGNDSMVDTPSSAGTDTGLGGQVTGNYCTLNPLDTAGGAAFSCTNGNLDGTFTNGGSTAIIAGTMYVSSGKWYAEFIPTAIGNNAPATRIGVQKNVTTRGYLGGESTNYAYRSNGEKQSAGSSVAYGSSYTTGDVIGVGLNMDAGTITFYKNGVSQGQAYSGLSGEYTFAYTDFGNGAFNVNFGQRPFAYTAPSGFKALCDTNLPAPVVAKPNTVMDVALYTGNGSARSITGLGFSPDMVWIKSRSAAGNHRITDIVRGATKELSPDLTNAEGTDANGVTSFDANGFSLGISSFQNGSGTTYAAWTWDAGSSTVTNTQGSITSSVRANPSAGFSIVSYTAQSSGAATIGHGLNVAPSLIILRGRTIAYNWAVYHSSLGNTGALTLNSTAAFTVSPNYWNDTSPTSTVFTGGSVSAGSGSMIAYCFAPVAGYSSFGSYTGNGSTDGPFVFTGFRVRWLMYKSTAAGGNWIMLDAARDSRNVASTRLLANTSDSEGTGTHLVDFLSNGFKIRNNDTNGNTNAQTYVWAAFAESPFQYARAR